MSPEMIAALCGLFTTAAAILAGVWRAAQITAHLDQAREEITSLKVSVAELSAKFQRLEVWMARLGFPPDSEITNPGIRR